MVKDFHEVKDKYLSDTKTRRRSLLVIMALASTFTPTLLFAFMKMPFIGSVFEHIFEISFWGLYFHIIGVILGITYIISQSACYRMKGRPKSVSGLIFAIISTLVPIVRWAIIILFYQQGLLELFT